MATPIPDYKSSVPPSVTFYDWSILVDREIGAKKLEQNPMKVLVIDDSAAVTDRVTELLKDVAGIDFGGRAGTVQEASQLIGPLNPDIVVLDLQLPDGNGLDVLKGIKKEHPETIVIVLTNSAALPVRKRCLMAGADFFLDKSDEFEKLSQIIAEIARTAQPAANMIPPSQPTASRKVAI